jgi:uncharacterized protein
LVPLPRLHIHSCNQNAAHEINARTLTKLLQGRMCMIDDEFELDERKAQSNFAKHRVTFEMARGAFSDVFGFEFLDERENHGEARLNLIGMSDGRLLFVTYVLRGSYSNNLGAPR